jgi:hypothetical protein
VGIVVETGSIVAGANSYVSVDDANSYFAARTNLTWAAATPSAKEAALLEACVYLDNVYRFLGIITRSDQRLQWPRQVDWDRSWRTITSYEIPQRLKDAQCELALLALSGSLMPEQSRGDRVASEAVGPLSVTYFSDAPAGRQFPYVDFLLQDITENSPRSGLSMDATRG